MLDKLPIEIVQHIVSHAVLQLHVSDRASLVSLARTSRAVYAVVIPLLYHTVVATSYQISSLLDDVTINKSVRHAFSHARELCDTGLQIDDEVAQLFSHVESLSCMVINASRIARASDGITDDENYKHVVQLQPPLEPTATSCRLQRLHIWGDPYSIAIQMDPRARIVTHICAYAPDPGFRYDWQELVNDPAQWMSCIVDSFPALTHIGFNLFDDDASDNEELYDPVPFTQALRVALHYSRLQVVAIRVAGRYISQWDSILAAMLKVEKNCTRIYVWKDDRKIHLWATTLQQDVLMGKSIWTEAVPLRLFDTAKPA